MQEINQHLFRHKILYPRQCRQELHWKAEPAIFIQDWQALHLWIWSDRWDQIVCIQADWRLVRGHCKQATSHRSSSTSSSSSLHPLCSNRGFGENILGCFTSSGTSLVPRSPSSAPRTMAFSSSRREAIYRFLRTAAGWLLWNDGSNNAEASGTYSEPCTQVLVFLTGFRWICISCKTSVSWGMNSFPLLFDHRKLMICVTVVVMFC